VGLTRQRAVEQIALQLSIDPRYLPTTHPDFSIDPPDRLGQFPGQSAPDSFSAGVDRMPIPMRQPHLRLIAQG
jgi:hypothetical protein